MTDPSPSAPARAARLRRRAPRTARPPRRTMRPPDGLPAYAALVGGIVLAVAAFLPWYAVNIAPPFEASSVSGWDATAYARIAAVLGVLIAGAAAALVLAGAGTLHLERGIVMALAWAVAGLSVIALALVAVRLVWLPEPAELLSRQIGVYVAVAAAIATVLGGVGRLAHVD